MFKFIYQSLYKIYIMGMCIPYHLYGYYIYLTFFALVILVPSINLAYCGVMNTTLTTCDYSMTKVMISFVMAMIFYLQLLIR